MRFLWQLREFFRPTPVQDRPRSFFVTAFVHWKIAQYRKVARRSKDPNHRRHEFRRLKAMLRKAARRFYGNGTIRASTQVLLHKKRPSVVLDSLNPARNSTWKHPIARASRYKVGQSLCLRDLSLINRPLETIEQLTKLATAESQGFDVQLDLLDSKATDVSPYLILNQFWDAMAPIFWGGKISRDVLPFLEATQLRHALHVSSGHMTDGASRVFPFHVRSRRKTGTSQSINQYLDVQTNEEKAQEVVEFICQHYQALEGCPFHSDRHGYVLKMVGELLDNAEKHAHACGDASWSIAGGLIGNHDAHYGEELPRVLLSLAIVSVGRTICENMLEAPPVTQRLLEPYLKKHSGHADKELLTTIFALQDRVTSYPGDDSETTTGGTGFPTAFDCARELNKSGGGKGYAKVTLMSGRACLKIGSPYNMLTKDSGLREVWFNAYNAADIPPESNSAMMLSSTFPGTLLALQIGLA